MGQPIEIHAWLADADGYYVGELDAFNSPDPWDQFVANAKANGQTAIPKTQPRPKDRPPTAAQQATIDARARLATARQTPWSQLTLAQQKQATDDAFACGETVPAITAVA